MQAGLQPITTQELQAAWEVLNPSKHMFSVIRRTDCNARLLGLHHRQHVQARGISMGSSSHAICCPFAAGGRDLGVEEVGEAVGKLIPGLTSRHAKDLAGPLGHLGLEDLQQLLVDHPPQVSHTHPGISPCRCCLA
jgi:hypothetical protein